MIEIIKERTLSVKEMKDKFKSGSMIEMLKVPKFTCSVLSARNSETDITIFLGLSNGNIVKLSFARQKHVKIQINKSFFTNMKMYLFFLVKKSLSTKEMYVV